MHAIKNHVHFLLHRSKIAHVSNISFLITLGHSIMNAFIHELELELYLLNLCILLQNCLPSLLVKRVIEAGARLHT